MTRNIYVGTDVDAVIEALMPPADPDADPPDPVGALTEAIQTFVMTDFPTRAKAIAGEIARARPHVVGLQEVSEVEITVPPDIPGFPTDGIGIDVEFLPILMAALADRGLNYEVAVSILNIEAEPVLPIPGALVRLVDYDVILIDQNRVTVNSRFAKTFEANVGEVAPGVALTRGWVMVNATIGGKTYTVVNSHFESGHQDPGLTVIREYQATEIVGTLAAMEISGPTIVMGDLNDYPGTPMYNVLAAAGFADVWDAIWPWRTGNTCCHATDLSNVFANFDRRIDYIWSRGFGDPRGLIYRTGWLPFLRVRVPDYPYYKLWPSDHAGVVANLRVPRSVLVAQ